MNLIDVSQAFRTDEQCLEYLEHMRWPDGVRCPICGGNQFSRVERKSATKNKRNRFYQCLEPTCRTQFSATAGTLFHDSHLPLTKWFMAIALMLNAKKGLSALQLQRDLKVNYRTAWYLNHRIREAMVENDGLLTGVVEIDETYVGGKTKRNKRGSRGLDRPKDAVIGMIERGGRLRYRHIGKGNATAKQAREAFDANVSPDVKAIVTDQSPIYPFGLPKEQLGKHFTIDHSREYVSSEIPGVHTNTIESAFSLLKRGIVGSFHKVSIKHLQRYLNEFSYRFNRRQDADIFEQTVARLMGAKPLPYKTLTAGPTSISR